MSDEKQSGKITIRIPEDRLDSIEQLVADGEFGSVSDLIRRALEDFFDARPKPGEHTRRMILELPKVHADRLDEYVRLGFFVSSQDAVRAAVAKAIDELAERELAHISKLDALRERMLKDEVERARIREQVAR